MSARTRMSIKHVSYISLAIANLAEPLLGIFVIGSGFSECGRLTCVMTDFSAYHYHAITVILTVRTWAVWEKNKRLTYGLFTIFILTTAAEFFLVGSYLNSSQRGFDDTSPL